jgi:hypothetical protein
MKTTSLPELDRAVETVGNRKDAWARLPVPARIALARQCVGGTVDVGEAMVAAGCEAKGLDVRSVTSGEEWLAGPVSILRNLRLLVATLSSIERSGYPDVFPGVVRRLPGGQLAVRVLPRAMFDRLMFPGTWSDIWMQPDVDEAGLRDTMAVAYHRPDTGKLALVLGAGNVASIGPMDVLYKLFVENRVVVLKVHPVNDYLGPLIERAFEPLVRDGYLRVVYGDVVEGRYLVHHPGIDEIHMTGSAAVHDRIVWGDTPEEQARRRAQREPKVTKRVTSELGCVTPVVVVPGDWSPGEIAFQAENVATMVANNASCNCNAAKLLVTWRGWRHRQAFLDRIAAVLGALPRRRAFYPGSVQRYAKLTAHPRSSPASAEAGVLQYVTIYDVDPAAVDDPAFREEAWCPVVAETALDADDAAGFTAAAAAFCNDRVDGTLSAVVLVDPRTRRRIGDHLDRAIAEMRYGTVAVNHWAAASYVLAVAPWGAYPGHTLDDVGSGIGFVHNTLMFDRPQKSVLWGPFTLIPKPPWFSTHRHGDVAARRMAAFEAAPSVSRLAALAIAAARA